MGSKAQSCTWDVHYDEKTDEYLILSHTSIENRRADNAKIIAAFDTRDKATEYVALRKTNQTCDSIGFNSIVAQVVLSKNIRPEYILDENVLSQISKVAECGNRTCFGNCRSNTALNTPCSLCYKELYQTWKLCAQATIFQKTQEFYRRLKNVDYEPQNPDVE